MRLLYKLRSNTTYTKFLNALYDREDQNYEKEEVTRPTVYFKKLEQNYMKPPETTAPMVNKQYILLLSWLITKQ